MASCLTRPQVAGSLGKSSSKPQQAEQAAGVPPHSDQRGHECQQQLKNQMGVHWSLVPWYQILDEIKNHCHPFPIREGGHCRDPNCDCFGHEDEAQFQGYCCKQCALRLREQCQGIVQYNPRPWMTNHGPHCQGTSMPAFPHPSRRRRWRRILHDLIVCFFSRVPGCSRLFGNRRASRCSGSAKNKKVNGPALKKSVYTGVARVWSKLASQPARQQASQPASQTVSKQAN